MLNRQQFYLCWQSVLLQFQLFGYTTYATVSHRKCLAAGRTVYALSVILAISALGFYVFYTKVTIFRGAQINIVTDQLVYLTIFTANLVALIESFLQRQNSYALFEQVYEIIAVFSSCSNSNCPLNIPQLCRIFMLKNWLQLGSLFSILTVAITFTSAQSWLYFRWIMLAEMMICVRLMEFAMLMEVLVQLLTVLERHLRSSVRAECEDCKRCGPKTLQYFVQSYDKMYALAGKMCRTYKWSLLVIIVDLMVGLVNTTFWFLFTLNNQYQPV